MQVYAKNGPLDRCENMEKVPEKPSQVENSCASDMQYEIFKLAEKVRSSCFQDLSELIAEILATK